MAVRLFTLLGSDVRVGDFFVDAKAKMYRRVVSVHPTTAEDTDGEGEGSLVLCFAKGNPLRVSAKTRVKIADVASLKEIKS